MKTLKTHAVHGGTLRYLTHDSATTGTPMTLSVFVPARRGAFSGADLAVGPDVHRR
jgi:S-formylglutathione hydrolase